MSTLIEDNKYLESAGVYKYNEHLDHHYIVFLKCYLDMYNLNVLIS